MTAEKLADAMSAEHLWELRIVVWACELCGEEMGRDVEGCPVCGGPVEKVDPLFVALIDALELVAPATKGEDWDDPRTQEANW